jgi:hypothetical protein
LRQCLTSNDILEQLNTLSRLKTARAVYHGVLSSAAITVQP